MTEKKAKINPRIAISTVLFASWMVLVLIMLSHSRQISVAETTPYFFHPKATEAMVLRSTLYTSERGGYRFGADISYGDVATYYDGAFSPSGGNGWTEADEKKKKGAMAWFEEVKECGAPLGSWHNEKSGQTFTAFMSWPSETRALCDAVTPAIKVMGAKVGYSLMGGGGERSTLVSIVIGLITFGLGAGLFRWVRNYQQG